MFFVVWKILLAVQGASINNNQGVDTLTITFSGIILGIRNTIKSIVLFIFEWNPLEHGLSFYAFLNIIFIIFAVFGIVYAVIKSKLIKRKTQFVLFLTALLLIPFFSCIWHFVSVGVSYRPMMLQCLSILLIFSAIIYEQFVPIRGKNLIAMLLSVMVFNNIITANISYYYMNRTNNNSLAVASEMLSRIHQMDANQTQIKVVGKRNNEVSLGLRDSNSGRIHMFSQMIESDLLFDEQHLVKFINEAFYCSYSSVDSQWTETNDRKTKINEMGVWPASDSIKIIDDAIVIKLSD